MRSMLGVCCLVLDEVEIVGAVEQVWELFEDREQLQRWMTERIRANVAINHGISIPSPT